MSEQEFELPYEATPRVRAALGRLERLEDASFSSDNRRLVLAGFDHNAIAIADVEITVTDDGPPHVQVHDVREISSESFVSPHGVTFIDHHTLLVASRYGRLAIVRLSDDGSSTGIEELTDAAFSSLLEPSAVAMMHGTNGSRAVLVCSNASNTVTTHRIQGDPPSVTGGVVLLHQWLCVPDGAAVSTDDRWLAISNHDVQTVMLYDQSTPLHALSKPDGILLGAWWPHGARFTADGRHLFVADGGRPYLHVYRSDDATWSGLRYPAASFRAMDDDVFERSRDLRSGGPKGLDFDRDERVLALTFENKPLSFFDIRALVDATAAAPADDALRLDYHLEVMENARVSQESIHGFDTSMSWRMTAPLRQLGTAWSRMRAR